MHHFGPFLSNDLPELAVDVPAEALSVEHVDDALETVVRIPSGTTRACRRRRRCRLWP